ncbi:MAG: hypothetical protein HQK76_17065 [Desulfobacterales bacterium]|nr:hypothetical protein [Desulfobacterales bacterium]
MKSFTLMIFILLITLIWNGKSIASTDKYWKQVEDAKNKGLPKTAIESLNQIIEITQAEKKYGEWIKAISEKIVLESSIQGNKPEEKVNLLKKEIEKADANTKPLLKAILATWYWHYFSNNRWRFMNRSATENVSDDDFTTWDLKKIFNEIDSLYQDILKEKDLLKTIPTKYFYGFLDSGSMPDDFRPNLYDFLGFEALNFYTSAEQAGAKPEDAFEIDSASDAFAPMEKFLSYQPETEDKDSSKYKAIILYQSLMQSHLNDSNKEVLFDIDLNRLKYIANASFGEGKNKIYIQRLNELIDKCGNSIVFSLASFYLSKAWGKEGDLVKARQTASEGYKRFPNSVGGNSCNVYISEIDSKSLTLKGERCVPTKPFKIQASYKNFTKLYFRVVPDNWERFRKKKYNYPNSIEEKDFNKLLSKTPDKEWSVELPKTPDFKENSIEIDVPKLPLGYYRIFASWEADFKNSSMVQQTWVWVSNLSLITRNINGKIDGFVVDAVSGEPVSDAKVWIIFRENSYYSYGRKDVTNDDGHFIISPKKNYWDIHLYVKKDKDEVFESNNIHPSSPFSSYQDNQTVFFTDRSLYRPGQTIYFKGICVHIDTEGKNYKIIPKQKLNVRLYDVNHQEVSIMPVETNEFGSFSGQFIAPSDRLAGLMYLGADKPSGSVSLRVEEYKRPKFAVELEKPTSASRLNDIVEIKGTAIAYSGAPIDNAYVRFRVKRATEYPYWWSWYYRPVSTTAQEITHGRIKTDDQGNFKISFMAKPDPSVSPQSEPTFTYKVYADVTSSDGETRSSETSLILGYKALKINISTDEKPEDKKEFIVKLNTTTLDGNMIAGSGKLKVFKLKEPKNPVPAKLWGDWWWAQSPREIKDGKFSSNWMVWPIDKNIHETEFSTKEINPCEIKLNLKEGLYKIECKAKDNFGEDVKAYLPLIVLPDWNEKKFSIKLPSIGEVSSNTVESGGSLKVLWGTGYETGRCYVEVERNHKIIKNYWTNKDLTQHSFVLPIIEDYKGGITVRLTQVRDSRAYIHNLPVYVPWDDKELNISMETYRDKLLPGEKEKWTIKIKGKRASIKNAEFVASLYDFSLDQFYPHSWNMFNFFRQEYSHIHSTFINSAMNFNYYRNNWNPYCYYPVINYTHFPYYVTQNFLYYQFYPGGAEKSRRTALPMSLFAKKEMSGAPAPETSAQLDGLAAQDKDSNEELKEDISAPKKEKKPDTIDVNDIKVRTNLNETAFFYPHLLMENDGSIKIEFTMPEALTKWKFLGLAHGKKCENGIVTAYTVTQKDLMVQPNPPRFLREGDTLYFTSKVINMSDMEQKGIVQINFKDILTDTSADEQISLNPKSFEFSLKPKASQGFEWEIIIPKGQNPLSYTVVAKSENYSDGEQGAVPVLPSRIFLTESIPLYVRDIQTKNFKFDRLKEIGKSDTFDAFRLSVQMSSNPIWYAIQALPYLIEFPYECSEQVFNRLYANSLASYIANSNPRIKEIFNQWRGTDALKSNLEKNQHLKSVMLEETPWIMQAKKESQAKKKVGILFEENTVKKHLNSSYDKLKNMQLSNGAWPWFPGGRPNAYITLYVTTGFGRLKHLGVKPDMNMSFRAINYLDDWIRDIYDNITHKELNHLSPIIAFYLYGRSFYLEEKPISKSAKVAVDYFLNQGEKYWLSLNSRISQGYLALALNRFGNQNAAKQIMVSIKERSVSNEEMGMFWREDELSWWWYRAQIETQAIMVEAFDEVMHDETSVEDCKVWLLKQKQTQDWKTTKATSDAIYALILRGTNYLLNNKIVKVTLGDMEVKPEKIEAGTGFYEKVYMKDEIKSMFSDIKVIKEEAGIAWGGVHFQYFEDMTKVTSHFTNLSLEKKLFVNRDTKKGVVIEPVNQPLSVGDLITVRITLKVDRDMEYVHLKDLRGSGLEPTNVISKYKFQDGLMYYESTRDVATHFFIDYLPKGTYVFEYTLRVQHRGKYQSGLAEIQCMYAPEFNSHSESVWIEVK